MSKCLHCRADLILYENWTATAKNRGETYCYDCNKRLKQRAYQARRYQAVTKPKRHSQGLSKPSGDPLDAMPLNPRIRSMMTPEIIAALNQPPTITTVTLRRR